MLTSPQLENWRGAMRRRRKLFFVWFRVARRLDVADQAHLVQPEADLGVAPHQRIPRCLHLVGVVLLERDP
jgi:hypothetical protein